MIIYVMLTAHSSEHRHEVGAPDKRSLVAYDH